jgi:shikimate dehydrogenase
VGAVNTIVVDHKRKMRGFNTDGPGFLTHLLELGFDPKGKRISILGAGGTTRSIISSLCLLPEGQGPVSVNIYNRTKENALKLVEEIGLTINTGLVSVVDDVEDLNVELADLLVNTTSVGLKSTDGVLLDPNLLHKNMLVYDVIYNPSETPLLVQAKKRGAKTANGLGMLFYQGVLAFQHWAEVELDEKTKKIMRKALGGNHGA